jgi:hypothetical protein
MGQCFWILVWDGWGVGLHMINPRLLTDGNGFNYFSYNSEIEKYKLLGELLDGLEYYKVIE